MKCKSQNLNNFRQSLRKRFKSVAELQRAFPTEQKCIKYLERIIWKGIIISPFDPTEIPSVCAVAASIAEGSVSVSISILKGPLPSIFTWTTIWLCTNSKGTSIEAFAVCACAPVQPSDNTRSDVIKPS